jgi:hypothetical protein
VSPAPLRLIAGLATAAVMSAGCYEATFPLDAAPQADLPAGVVGSWRCLPADPDDTDEAITLIVKRTRERVYDVSLHETNQDPDRFEGYASIVRGTPVINLKDLDRTNQKPWVFLRTAFLRPDVLAIRVLSEKAITAANATAAGIRTLLEQSKDDGLFEDTAVCVRIKS